MKTKLSLLTLFAFVATGTTLLADNENYDGQSICDEGFIGRDLVNSSWVRSYLELCYFEGVDLTRSDFSDAAIIGTDFCDGSILKDAVFKNATLGSHGEWVRVWNADLTGADFSGATLWMCNFSSSSLENVVFKDAVISGSSGFYSVDLTGADFSGATISSTYFCGADLTGADFSGATMNYTLFNSLDDYGSTILKDTVFVGADLNGVDFRGTTGVIDISEARTVKNVFLADGKIEGFSMTSSEDSFRISGSAKIYTNASISGGAELTVMVNSVLEIINGKVLTLGDSGSLALGENAELHFAVAGDSVSSVSVTDNGSITLSGTAKFVIDYAGSFDEDTSFSVMTWTDDASVSGLDSLTKGSNISLLVDGVAYDSELWDFSTENNALTIFGIDNKTIIIKGLEQIVNLKTEEYVGIFDASLTAFSGTVSGAGSLNSSGTLTFSGDASAHAGTTNITAGTFTITEDAKLGAGVFDVAGTLVLKGSRTFVNATSGNGELSLASGSDVSFAQSVGVKTLSVENGATLRGSVSMTHGADAKISLAGTLVLNVDKGEKVALGGGKVALASSAKLDLVGNGGSSFVRAASVQIETLENGERVTIFEGGAVSGDVVAFLNTDSDLAAYAQNYAVVYDESSGGLSVQVVKNASALTDGIDTSELSASFVDWALSDANAALGNLASGFVSAANLGSLSGGNDPLLNAILANDAGTARAILDRLSPKSYAAMVAMPVESFNSDVRSISARLEQRRHDRFSKNAQWEFFAQLQTSSVENDTAPDAPTFDFDTTGLLAGADCKLDQNTILGVALGASTGEAKVHNGGGKIESTDFRITGFAGKAIENYFVNAGAQLGYASHDIKRNTDYGNASGDTTGWSAGLFADAGTLITLSEAKKIYATPYIGLAYMHTQADAFTESGSDKAFDADAISGDSLRARLGCGFSWGFAASGAVWRLGLDVAYSHDFLGDEVDIDVTTQDGSSITETAKALPEDMFSIGPSFNVDISSSASIYGGYSFNAGTDSSVNHSANVGFRMRF